MIVIPAVDIRGGVAVRLVQGRADRESLRAGDPIAAARRWAACDPSRLHLVDLDGAFEGRPANAALIARIIAAVEVPVEVGGGIRTEDDVDAYLRAGASRVIVGTRAAEEPAFLMRLASAHPGRVNLGLDCAGGRVAVKGWVEASVLGPLELLERLRGAPLGEVIFTEISKDGMLSGPALEATREMVARAPYPVIASGGVACVEDLQRLAETGCFGAIVGRALYDSRIDLRASIQTIEGR
jgi:phosphoribosylformimino-5-aminoimidazole carboxamide ribotide isomerase